MKNPEYILLAQSFEKWLQVLEYARATIYASGNYLRDFFNWLEKQNIISLDKINKQVIKNYHAYLQTRKNKCKPGGLSQNYIISNFNALRRFSRYLQLTGKGTLEIEIQIRATKTDGKTVLSLEEIKALYLACENDILGIRDKAILGIYYGCGLRRSEGVNLDLKDILLKDKLVYVRKGKNYRERYVPLTESVKEDLENYIYTAREKILSFKNVKPEAFFLSYRVKRMHSNSIINRLDYLVSKARINKKAGLHALRHSIASHLLQSGMTLEEVSRFLGHSTLESTQIYTHLDNE